MFKSFRFFFLLVLIFSSYIHAKSKSILKFSAKSVLIVNTENQMPIYEYKKNIVLPAASTIKLAIALYASERYKETDLISVHSNAVVKNNYESKAGFLEKEEFLLKDVLYGLLLPSGNDAARAIAYKEKSLEIFKKNINDWTIQKGLSKTIIDDPAGISMKTKINAVDLSKLLFLSLENPMISTILKTKTHTFYSQKNRMVVVNNRLKVFFRDGFEVYGKTGTTKKAGECFAGVLEKNKKKYTIVLLGSRSVYKDLANITEYLNKL